MLLGEARVVGEIADLVWRLPELARQPRGRGTVVVLPGFGASDASTWALRSYLRALGYDTHGWGLGLNAGDVRSLVPRMIDVVAKRAAEVDGRVRLVGWSLGGYIARETARERPALVERVVTLGSPVVGGPKYTAIADLYRRSGYDLDAIEAAVEERNRVPITVPITAIYSRRDGIVAWQACIDHSNPQVEHVEIDATHLGLGFNAAAYRILAERLATPRPA